MEAFAKTLPNKEQEQDRNRINTPALTSQLMNSAENSPRVKRVKSELSDEELRAVYTPIREEKHCGCNEGHAQRRRATRRKLARRSMKHSPAENRVEAYAKHVKINGTEEQFLPYPATSLNNGCYDDEGLLRLAPKTEAVSTGAHEFKSDAIP